MRRISFLLPLMSCSATFAFSIISESRGSNVQRATLQEAKTRRSFFGTIPAALGFLSVAAATTNAPANAAPPIAIIAEELGYFPVQNKKGEVVYVSQRVSRESSKQAIELAKKLSEQGVYMAGTYWCPHTSRQKELFGREAWSMIKYVECSPKGYGADPKFCVAQNVDGYPTWVFPGGKQVGGERPLSVLANEIGFQGFREELEKNLPPAMGSQGCLRS
ncbi:hypothetical protein MPSEU_000442800 [Mayamaea pseudoterrestris]|nr:hypothetical protein MPSEU_000442800 [Mayamaea pseudoterrestris]